MRLPDIDTKELLKGATRELSEEEVVHKVDHHEYISDTAQHDSELVLR